MLNIYDKEYHRLLEQVMNYGKLKKNRTGVVTLGVFGAQARFDLSEGFPLLTTKKVAFNLIKHELLWFLSGSTNIKYLVDNNVHIWDDNAYAKYLKEQKNNLASVCPLNKQDYIWGIANDSAFAAKHGELGEGTYGGMWRAFPYCYHIEGYEGSEPYEDLKLIPKLGHVDQIKKIVETLRSNPDDRRMIVSAWHPYWVDHCALPPCHVLFHFNTEELTSQERNELYLQKFACYFDKMKGEGRAHLVRDEFISEALWDKWLIPKRRLNCLLYQRSCDLFLGVPFNIASYALLTEMVSQIVNMVPGEFIHTYGDLHLYENHLDQVKQQLSRDSYVQPQLVLNPEIKELSDFKADDIQLHDYTSHPAIKAEMAV